MVETLIKSETPKKRVESKIFRPFGQTLARLVGEKRISGTISDETKFWAKGRLTRFGIDASKVDETYLRVNRAAGIACSCNEQARDFIREKIFS